MGATLAEVSATAMRTNAGWNGMLRQVEARYADGGCDRYLVADFPVADEHTLLYARVDGNESSLLAALSQAVPRFSNESTLADLLTLPERSDVLASLDAPTQPLFSQLRREWTLSGVSFHIDGDPDAGRVAVDFAVAPRVSLRELAARLNAESRLFAARGATIYGEHCGVVLSDATAVAAVYGDRHMTIIRGTYRPAMAERFGELIRRLTAQLPLRGSPPVRERAVVHGIPAGWTARLRDLTTHLIAPDGKTFITVLPATPLELRPATVHKILYEDVIVSDAAQLVDSTTRQTSRGLSAQVVTARVAASDRSRPFELMTAVLRDARFRYVVRHENPTAQTRALFSDVVDSVEPVPRSSRVDHFNQSYWVE
jgi:hypothetical protein